MNSQNDPIEVDALVIGGGAQGLTVLNELTERDFSAVVVTNDDLGCGQTLHSHGVLNTGYAAPNPTIRESLRHDWLPFAKERGLDTYGADHFFVVIPTEPYELLSEAWDIADYPYEDVTPDDLPPGFREGDLFKTDDRMHVVRIKEYTVPKRGLVQSLSDGLSDRIIKGDITQIRFAPTDVTLSIDAVDIIIHATRDSVTLSPSAVVLAVGSGSKRLIEGIMKEPSFGEAIGAIGESAQVQNRIQEQVSKITHERLHMICIRGPTEFLPPVNLLLAAQHTIVVTADVNETHQQHGDGETVTWYVTPQDPKWQHVEDVPDAAHAEPNSSTIARGIATLTSAFPSLRDAAMQPDSPLEFGAYAGYKQNVGDDRVTPMSEPLAGITNTVLSLPTLVGSAWLNAERTAELVAGIVEPSGSQPRIEGVGENVPIGDVRENSDGFEWLSWEQFSNAHRIDAGE